MTNQPHTDPLINRTDANLCPAHAADSGLFSGVLLASDYDGTFVTNDKTILPSVREALQYFQAQGGLFTVCTGRCYLGFHAYSPEWINAPVLLANGGMAYDYQTQQILFEDGIGDEGIAPLRGVLREFPALSVEMYPFHSGYAARLTPQAERHFTSQSIPFLPVEDPADAPRPWTKVMLGGTPADIARVQTFLRSRYPEIAFLPTSGGYLEVLIKGVNKGTALRKLAKQLGVQHVFAVGDGYNDVEMLQAADHAFVPENGDECAKACAGTIVRDNNHGAVAHVVELLTKRFSTKAGK